MKKVPSQAKGIGTFSFWGGFEAGIQSTGSLPDMAFTNQRYETLRDPFKSQSHPLAFTDLDTSALKREREDLASL
jgi:hypothetical protein